MLRYPPGHLWRRRFRPSRLPASGVPPVRPRSAVSRGASSGDSTLPNLIIIGAQKCGTSGLHYYLGLHPEVSMSTPKELNYFIAERNWGRGPEWYARHFDPTARCRGESSPNYTAFPQHMGVPERMAGVIPDAKLIYIVRDPLDRIAAHYVHNFAKRREKGDLRDDAAAPEHLLRRPQPVLQPAAALSRPLRPRPDPRDREQRPAGRASGDAAPRLRVRRRRYGLRASEVRARAPLDLAQEARDADGDARPEDEPHPPRSPAAAAGLARTRCGPAAVEADLEAAARGAGGGARRGGARGPARGRRAAARVHRPRSSPAGRFERERRRGKRQGPSAEARRRGRRSGPR